MTHWAAWSQKPFICRGLRNTWPVATRTCALNCHAQQGYQIPCSQWDNSDRRRLVCLYAHWREIPGNLSAHVIYLVCVIHCLVGMPQQTGAHALWAELLCTQDLTEINFIMERGDSKETILPQVHEGYLELTEWIHTAGNRVHIGQEFRIAAWFTLNFKSRNWFYNCKLCKTLCVIWNLCTLVLLLFMWSLPWSLCGWEHKPIISEPLLKSVNKDTVHDDLWHTGESKCAKS